MHMMFVTSSSDHSISMAGDWPIGNHGGAYPGMITVRLVLGNLILFSGRSIFTGGD